jgi:hypothetical protein
MISTENAGGLVGTSTPNGATVTVKFLIGTFVQSIGRDVRAGEVLTVSQKDASFLLPYSYATRDLETAAPETAETLADTPPVEDEVADDESEDEVADDESDEEVTPATAGKRSGKRR